MHVLFMFIVWRYLVADILCAYDQVMIVVFYSMTMTSFLKKCLCPVKDLFWWRNIQVLGAHYLAMSTKWRQR